MFFLNHNRKSIKGNFKNIQSNKLNTKEKPLENQCSIFCNELCLPEKEQAYKKVCQWDREQIDKLRMKACGPLNDDDCRWVSGHLKNMEENECHLNNRVNSTCFNSHDGHECKEDCYEIKNAGSNFGQC